MRLKVHMDVYLYVTESWNPPRVSKKGTTNAAHVAKQLDMCRWLVTTSGEQRRKRRSTVNKNKTSTTETWQCMFEVSVQSVIIFHPSVLTSCFSVGWTWGKQQSKLETVHHVHPFSVFCWKLQLIHGIVKKKYLQKTSAFGLPSCLGHRYGATGWLEDADMPCYKSQLFGYLRQKQTGQGYVSVHPSTFVEVVSKASKPYSHHQITILSS